MPLHVEERKLVTHTECLGSTLALLSQCDIALFAKYRLVIGSPNTSANKSACRCNRQSRAAELIGYTVCLFKKGRWQDQVQWAARLLPLTSINLCHETIDRWRTCASRGPWRLSTLMRRNKSHLRSVLWVDDAGCLDVCAETGLIYLLWNFVRSVQRGNEVTPSIINGNMMYLYVVMWVLFRSVSRS